MSSLTERTVKNIGLVSVVQVSGAIISTVATIALARLLTPFDFGIVAVASIVLGLIGQFSDFGLTVAVVQQDGNTGEAAQVASTLRLLIACILLVLTFFLAPFLAAALGAPAATDVIRVSSLLWLISGVGFIPNAVLWKELGFRQLSIIGVAGTISGATVSILLAVLRFSFWSIVFGNMLASVVTVGLLRLLRPWSLRPRFDRVIASDLLRYGKHVFAFTFLVFVVMNIDNVAVATVIGTSALGAYYIAYKWAIVISGFATRTIGRVLFPTYSLIKTEPARIRRGFLTSLRTLSLFALPAQVGISLVAAEFVSLVLGPQWDAAIVPLEILAMFGLITVLLQPFGDLFLATGHADLLSKSNAINLAMLAPLVIPAARLFGLLGVSIAVLLTYVQHLIVMLWLLRRQYGIGVREVAGGVRTSVVACGGMASVIMFLKFALPIGWDLFGLEIVLGASVYFLLVYCLDPEYIGKVLNRFRPAPIPTQFPELAPPRP